MHATNRVFSRLHALFSYNFLMNGPIKTIFDMYMGNKTSFTLLRNMGEINLCSEKYRESA